MKKILSIVTIMLAMVLCFTGCQKTYTDEDIESACANAYQGMTALTMYFASNPPAEEPYIITNFAFDSSEKKGSYYFSFDGDNPVDLSSYLGTKVDGYFYAEYGDYGAVDFVIWFADKETCDALYVEVGEALTWSQMLSYAEEGHLVGSYPYY